MGESNVYAKLKQVKISGHGWQKGGTSSLEMLLKKEGPYYKFKHQHTNNKGARTPTLKRNSDEHWKTPRIHQSWVGDQKNIFSNYDNTGKKIIMLELNKTRILATSETIET